MLEYFKGVISQMELMEREFLNLKIKQHAEKLEKPVFNRLHIDFKFKIPLYLA